MSAPAPPRLPMDDRIRARRRQVARSRLRRRRRIAGSIAAVVILTGAAFGLSHSPLFAVDDVRVDGVTGDRAEQVRAAAAVTPGERLFSVDLDTIENEVSALAWVREVAVSRLPPSTVAIAVSPREPVAVVRLADSSWLVDGDAVVVAGGADDRLPVIDAPGSVLPGAGVEVSDAAVRNALEVHQALPGPLRTAVVRYEAPSARGLRLLLAGPEAAGRDAGPQGDGDDGVWVRFGVAERAADKAQVIGLLLEQAREQAALRGTPDDLGVAELDVRAPDNPVLIPRS